MFFAAKMGVTLLRKRLLAKLARAAIEGTSVPEEVDGLFLDANAIFHPVAAQLAIDVRGFDGTDPVLTKQCADNIFAAIVQIANFYRPRKWLYIAVDGVIPMAKIQQQKQRRYATAVHLKPGDYNSSFITPGTPFMARVHARLSEKITTLYSTDVLKFQHCDTIVYSSYLDPGEGEHKIMQYIREKQVSGTNIIYGNDADLLLLGLGLGIPGLFVCSNTVRISGVDRTLPPLSIDELREGLIEKLRGNFVYDFIFACSMLGNDFLPRSFLFSDIGDALDTIIELLAQNGGMLSSQQSFAAFLGKLAELESFSSSSSPSLPANAHNVMAKSLQREVWRSQHTGETHVMFQSPLLEEVAGKEDKNSALAVGWYTKMFPAAGQIATRIGMACLEYLRGLYWIFYYYLAGQDSVTWLWYYPHHYTPLFGDLYVVLGSMKQATLEYEVQDVRPLSGERRFTPLHQLTAVMHWLSMKHIPREITDVFFTTRSPLLDMMPTCVIEDSDLTESVHQTKVIVPFADYHTIMLELSLVLILESLAKSNSPQQAFTDTRKELSGDRDRRKVNIAALAIPAALPEPATGVGGNTPTPPTFGTRGGRGRGLDTRRPPPSTSFLQSPAPTPKSQTLSLASGRGGSVGGGYRYQATRGGKTIY